MNTVSRTIRPRVPRGPDSITSRPLSTRGRSLPPPRSAARHRASFVDAQRAPVQFLAVETGDRGERMLLAGHLHEAEALGRAGEELPLHLRRFHFPEWLEQRDQLVLGRLRRQVAYEDLHLELL